MFNKGPEFKRILTTENEATGGLEEEKIADPYKKLFEDMEYFLSHSKYLKEYLTSKIKYIKELEKKETELSQDISEKEKSITEIKKESGELTFQADYYRDILKDKYPEILTLKGRKASVEGFDEPDPKREGSKRIKDFISYRIMEYCVPMNLIAGPEESLGRRLMFLAAYDIAKQNLEKLKEEENFSINEKTITDKNLRLFAAIANGEISPTESPNSQYSPVEFSDLKSRVAKLGLEDFVETSRYTSSQRIELDKQMLLPAAEEILKNYGNLPESMNLSEEAKKAKEEEIKELEKSIEVDTREKRSVNEAITKLQKNITNFESDERSSAVFDEKGTWSRKEDWVKDKNGGKLTFKNFDRLDEWLLNTKEREEQAEIEQKSEQAKIDTENKLFSKVQPVLDTKYASNITVDSIDKYQIDQIKQSSNSDEVVIVIKRNYSFGKRAQDYNTLGVVSNGKITDNGFSKTYHSQGELSTVNVESVRYREIISVVKKDNKIEVVVKMGDGKTKTETFSV